MPNLQTFLSFKRTAKVCAVAVIIMTFPMIIIIGKGGQDLCGTHGVGLVCNSDREVLLESELL